ncbi:MAG TPA: FecR family protein [Candidatus Acidoferrales bacterium]|nr:FecR family protein [Candidatus Acidoferrales bacterium]
MKVMKTRSRFSWFVAALAGTALIFPPGLLAQQAQSAGQIPRLIPNVNLQHGQKVQLAAPGAKVSWGDKITTDEGGRARIVLDDGSILNVGSGSSLTIVQHDSAAQRTQIQLAYGRLRASAVRLARANSSFEVRTPTAVAGVVGTGFDIEFINEITNLSVTEGSVSLCNLAGQCVTIGAGFTSTIRGNQPPTQPVPTPPTAVAQNVSSTSVGSGAGTTTAGVAVGTTAVTHSLPILITVVAAAAAGGIATSVSARGKKCGCTTVP